MQLGREFEEAWKRPTPGSSFCDCCLVKLWLHPTEIYLSEWFEGCFCRWTHPQLCLGQRLQSKESLFQTKALWLSLTAEMKTAAVALLLIYALALYIVIQWIIWSHKYKPWRQESNFLQGFLWKPTVHRTLQALMRAVTPWTRWRTAGKNHTVHLENFSKRYM